MNTAEAVLSLLVFTLVLSTFVNYSSPELDDSLYKLKFAEDVWRILYLKGDLEDFQEDKLKEDLNNITELTGICVSIEEKNIKSCEPSQFVVIKRIAFINGSPEMLTIKIGVSHG